MEIGRNKYNHLKTLEKLTKKQQEQVRSYEEKREFTPEQKSRIKEYARKLFEPKKEVIFSLTPSQLYNYFTHKFFEIEGKKFVRNKESYHNVAPLIYYFSKSKLFMDCKNLMTEFVIGGKVKKVNPSFEKGLLIIGSYGNGKTSAMRAIEQVFKGIKNYSFKGYSANEVVEMYESCSDPDEKDFFWKEMVRGVLYFDDVKTERMASNYGKANLMKDVLEKRYSLQKKTHITCNLKEGSNRVEDALLEFGEKYGSRVFDRLFEMFNIIEFKGKSFRK